MQRRVALGLLALLLLGSAPVMAEEACKSADALGVSRTIEVDTTCGPWFGEPNGDPDFLKPGEVVLTFDDGPAPASTKAILDALAAQCTKATFFMVGEMASAYPDMVREVIAQGHTVGTHTWSHANLKRQSTEGMKTQIESGFNAVEKAAGGPIAPFFRYPYLNDTSTAVAYLRSRNIGQFAIDIDTLDWLSRNAQSVIHRAMAGLAQRGRGIILMHDIHPSTAAAVPQLLAQLKAKGYKIVHLRPKVPVETLAAYPAPSREARHTVSATGTGSSTSVRRQYASRKSSGASDWKWPPW
jgi:peptidoglycan/xylan/chitin deacetylase (PgdA/CDA1 family)